MGCVLEWKENPDKTQSKSALFTHSNPTDESNWKSQHEWLKNTIEKFDFVFRKRIRNLAV
jgi:hypothetical protein